MSDEYNGSALLGIVPRMALTIPQNISVLVTEEWQENTQVLG